MIFGEIAIHHTHRYFLVVNYKGMSDNLCGRFHRNGLHERLLYTNWCRGITQRSRVATFYVCIIFQCLCSFRIGVIYLHGNCSSINACLFIIYANDIVMRKEEPIAILLTTKWHKLKVETIQQVSFYAFMYPISNWIFSLLNQRPEKNHF